MNNSINGMVEIIPKLSNIITIILIVLLVACILGAMLSISVFRLHNEVKQLKTDYSILLENYNENEYMYKKMEGNK